MIEVMEKDAVFSPCRKYRYGLSRRWADGPRAMFIGLNPSTADETTDDPTIRRCVGFARAWGYGAIVMTNLFAFRATQPDDMKREPDPIGPENDITLKLLQATAGIVVAAWGVHGTHLQRDRQVRRMIQPLHCLRLTKGGHPGHPLYLPASLTPMEWPLDALESDDGNR